jgi:predicted peptidase
MFSRVLGGLGALALAAVVVAAPVWADDEKKDVAPALGKLLEKQFEKGNARYDYLLYLPADYGKEGKRSPLVLFLHGLGDKLARMKRFGLPKQIERKKGVTFILVAPENPQRGWNAKNLTALLDDVVAKYKVDKDRIYVTGLSMGGFGTFSLIAASPDRFAAAIPICGGGNPATAKKLKDIPIWVFHGTKDETVPAKRSEAMVKALKDAGSKNVKFTLYPEAKHDSWTKTYRNEEVWKWLLEQKRPTKTGVKKEKD